MHLYVNSNTGRLVYIDCLDPEAARHLDAMVRERVASFSAPWWDFVSPTSPDSGQLVSCEDLDDDVDEHRTIWGLASQFAEKAGVPVADKEGVFEFWNLFLSTQNGVDHSQPFDTQVHFDDDECVMGILVTHRDDSLRGADLEVMLDRAPSLWDVFGDEGESMQIPLHTGAVVVMDGGHYHSFARAAGSGGMRYIKFILLPTRT